MQSQIPDGLSELGSLLSHGEFVESPFDQPVEEQRTGDPDQRDDDFKFKPGTVCLDLEPDLAGGRKALHGIGHSDRFRYFLDGSLRTKYLGDFVEDRFSFPILATENVCAVIRREGAELSPEAIGDRLYFVFPHKESGLIADTTFERIDELRTKWEAAGSRLRIAFLEKTDVLDVRHSMLGKARSLMHDLEHELAVALPRDSQHWLVMDGAIRKAEFMELEHTVGLAKSFSRRPVFDLGDNKPLMITTYLSKVRAGERSAVFRQTGTDDSDKDLVFWYVRLRTYPPMEPLGGLVKIDFSLRGKDFDGSTTGLVDEISSEIYDMRLPSLYPYPRWPSFVYAIRAAELTMRARFLNPEIIGYYGHLLKVAIQRARS